MQWIIYGRTRFNKTATERLYNLKFEKEQPIESNFDVWGRMYFTHAGEDYILYRVAHYKKSILGETSYINEDLDLWKVTATGKQDPLKDPVTMMELLLPSELSEYFFFDGESMIAALKVKGTDAAKNLRKALYAMFDLDILDMACMHIGDNTLKETVLGKLYLSQGETISGSEISIARGNVEHAQDLIAQVKENLEKKKNQEIMAFDELAKSSKDFHAARRRIEIMEAVREHFSQKPGTIENG